MEVGKEEWSDELIEKLCGREMGKRKVETEWKKKKHWNAKVSWTEDEKETERFFFKRNKGIIAMDGRKRIPLRAYDKGSTKNTDDLENKSGKEDRQDNETRDNDKS